MKFLLRKCKNCNTYTLKIICSKCKEDTFFAHPSKFSPDDKYAIYRIREKSIN